MLKENESAKEDEGHNQQEKTSIVAVDLFCGAGGLTCGLRRAGINVVAGIDSDSACSYAYKTNNNANFINKKIEDVDSVDIEKELSGSAYSLLCGCAPCQTFSSINQKASKSDQRWYLLQYFANLIAECEPDFVAMENVPGLEGKDVFKGFCNQLKGHGYLYTYLIVNSADYGIPQNRRRLVLVASRHGEIDLLETLEANRDTVTVKEAIGHLAPLHAGECDKSDSLHFSSRLTPKNMRRIKASTPGGTWRSWDESLVLPCHTQEAGDGYGAVYGRMEWGKVAPTITTQFYNYGSGRFGHPEQDRAISFREGALLQTFPSDYVFFDPAGRIGRRELGRLIGNAVPVHLGEMIGQAILKHKETLSE